MTKDDVLALLQKREGDCLSGEELARSLSLSRTAVWKAIGQLRAEGYPIESATRRGYRLLPGGDVLTAAGVREHLRRRELRVEVLPSVGSTNTELKARAERGEAAGSVLIALEQTAGRGRMGRGFYSPEGSGLYMSVLYRPSSPSRTPCASRPAPPSPWRRRSRSSPDGPRRSSGSTTCWSTTGRSAAF